MKVWCGQINWYILEKKDGAVSLGTRVSEEYAKQSWMKDLLT